MTIKRELGSEAVRKLIERASARAQHLSARSVRDPWPSSRRVISDSVDAGVTGTRTTNE